MRPKILPTAHPQLEVTNKLGSLSGPNHSFLLSSLILLRIGRSQSKVNTIHAIPVNENISHNASSFLVLPIAHLHYQIKSICEITANINNSFNR